ncbi:MAG: phage tail protein [Pseudobutyrivibrio sp.]|nr:phage tail protein [Pseudobutyrivibrio sp.]
MYKIYIVNGDTRTCIYDDRMPDEEYKLINPKLTMEENAAGSLTFKLPVSNRGYSAVSRLKSFVEVLREDTLLWEGRVLKDEEDFYKNRTIYCEGILSCLNDVIQPPANCMTMSIYDFLSQLLSVYNEKTTGPTFRIGSINMDVYDNAESIHQRYTNYDNTWECIKTKLIDILGGHFYVRNVIYEGVLTRYIEYMHDAYLETGQIIEFGQNLLDYTKSYDMSSIATVVIPLGATKDTEDIPGLDSYVDISSLPSQQGKVYVKDDTAIQQYGWIEKVVHYDDITEPTLLRQAGSRYLNDNKFEVMELSVKAVDLHNINSNIESLGLMEIVRVYSKPHDLNRDFFISKIDIPLYDPGKTEYTLTSTVKSDSYVEQNVHNTLAIYKEKRVTDGKVARVTKVANDAASDASDALTAVSNVSTTVSQLSDRIILMVDANDNIAEVKLGLYDQDPDKTIFQVRANNLNLSATDVISLMSGGTINLNAGSGIEITSPGFSVTRGGSLTSVLGKIGGWTINANNIYKEVEISGVTYATTLSSSATGGVNGFAFSISKTENGTTTFPLVMRNSGKIECANLAATGGTIGGWDISSTSLYKVYVDQGVTYESVMQPATIRLAESAGGSTFSVNIRPTGVFNDNDGYYINFATGICKESKFEAYEFKCESNGKIQVGTGGITSYGNVEMFSSTPYIDMHMNNSTDDFTYRLIHRAADTLDFIGHNSSTWGILRAAQFAVQSSKHVKENIEPISEDEAKKILELNPVKFDYISGNKNQRGLIAEEVQDILPEMVEVPDGYEEFNPDEPWNTPSIYYSKFVPYLIKMVQMQQKEIDILKEAIKNGETYGNEDGRV